MKSLRAWATPLVVGSFLVIAVTGLLMFFHLNTGLMKGIHEWIGWVLVVGVVAHLVLNWRAFTTYFRRPAAVSIMGVGAVVLAATFLPIGAEEGPGDITRVAMTALSGGRIETLAELSGSDTASVLADLGAAGIAAEGSDTPQGLSGGDRAAELKILTTIFAD